MKEYDGDIIFIERLEQFFPVDSWQWNEGEIITLDDISCAIHDCVPENSEPFGDTWKHLCLESKSTEWHVGRIIYFIKHPEEIRDIEIDNVCYDGYIFPVPTIIDGNHRFMAAMWLRDQGRMEKVHCRYGGRMDVLDYLIGAVDECPYE